MKKCLCPLTAIPLLFHYVKVTINTLMIHVMKKTLRHKYKDLLQKRTVYKDNFKDASNHSNCAPKTKCNEV